MFDTSKDGYILCLILKYIQKRHTCTYINTSDPDQASSLRYIHTRYIHTHTIHPKYSRSGSSFLLYVRTYIHTYKYSKCGSSLLYTYIHTHIHTHTIHHKYSRSESSLLYAYIHKQIHAYIRINTPGLDQASSLRYIHTYI
jgi:hypothetical protein